MNISILPVSTDRNRPERIANIQYVQSPIRESPGIKTIHFQSAYNIDITIMYRDIVSIFNSTISSIRSEFLTV